jgi:hypothetical protein
MSTRITDLNHWVPFDVLLARGRARADILLACGPARADILLARGRARFDALSG